MVDYLIVGGGLAGCVLASRLKEYDPDASVTLVEAGPNEHANPLMIEPMGTFQLHLSQYEYNYRTAPQSNLDGRQVFNAGGKQLSGSSAVNYACWTRGDAVDYDLWGNTVGDQSWSYKGILPYIKRTENHHDAAANPKEHGFKTYIHDSLCPGDPKGIAPYTENWRDGKRQPSGKAYGLKDVEVLTNTLAIRLVVERTSSGNLKATGVLLDNGDTLSGQEVIVSCGTLRSPQLLLLSGIGPTSSLEPHSIPQLLDLPVGQKLFDHSTVSLFYRVKHPELGVCAGSQAWNKPHYADGVPVSWIITGTTPGPALHPALVMDGVSDPLSHPHAAQSRSHYEILPIYAPTASPWTGMDHLPFNGSILTVGVLNLLPTSRGSVTLASTDAKDHPVIDPNYNHTETDKAIIRSGIRTHLQTLDHPALKEVIDTEVPPEGYPVLTSKSTDEEIDARVRRIMSTWFHPQGSCAMGQVVDTEFKVKGIEGLRVVDASIIPAPIAGHTQVATYALAEKAADVISGRV